jgi:probable phosphoglycerate mutase
MKKVLYLMRHGQTLFNVRHKVQGFCDSPLTELGIQQAKIARRYFDANSIKFDHAYSSTSERASDTLELITDMEYKRVKGLKEWNFGVFEAESEELNPKLPYGDFFVPYGGEGERDFQKRITDTIMEIMVKDNHECVLMVSHGASCRTFLRYWGHTSTVDHAGRIGNCCILKFAYENNEFQLLEVINHDFNELVKK